MPGCLRPLETDASAGASLSAEAVPRLYELMTALAAACETGGQTQLAADILAFLLLQPAASAASRIRAEDMFAELESRICPRVILDARELAADMDMQSMVEYLLDSLESEPNLTLALRRLDIA